MSHTPKSPNRNNNEINGNAFNGIDDDLDGLIDENYYLHYRQKRIYYNETSVIEQTLFDIINPRAYIDFISLENNNGYIDVFMGSIFD